jgi:hypothetical protein
MISLVLNANAEGPVMNEGLNKTISSLPED